jgi:membrane protein implicated in regulation of membrane protease activity
MTDGLVGFLASPWGWLLLAAVMAIVEILVPGTYMIWLSAAALATALTVAAVPLTLDGQLASFAVWILVSLFASRQLKGRAPLVGDRPGLNRLSHRVAGETAVVTEAILDGRGRVRLGDSEWPVQGPDCPPGTRVRVEGANGAVLQVTLISPALPGS